MIVALWTGDRRRGERVMEDVQAFGTPQSGQVGPANYADTLAQFDAGVPDGCHWEVRTRSLPALTEGALDAMIAAKARAASPLCWMNWHHFHGAATRMAPEGAAFGLRREDFMVEIIAGWKPDGDDGASHRRWARDLWQSLAPFALLGGYANLLGPDDREQAADAYGGNAPGSGSSSAASIPMGSSRPPSRCRTDKPLHGRKRLRSCDQGLGRLTKILEFRQ